MKYFSDARKIGACCPDTSKVAGPMGLAGDLPATAPKDEDNDIIAKITRSENRGKKITHNYTSTKSFFRY